MLPLIIGGAIGSALGGIANGIFGKSAADREAEAAEELQMRLQGIQDPQFSGQYTPEAYQASLYGPQQDYTYQQIADSPEGRAMMVQALQRMQGNADQSIGSQNELDRYNAQSDASRLARQREGAISAAMQRRGQMTPGLELMMRQQASQDAAEQARGSSMNAAAMAALQRLQANNAMFGAAGQLRGQDVGLNAANTDIINRFNAMNTQQRNAIANANTDLINRQNLYNVGGRNDAQQYNLGRNDANAMNKFNAAMGKAGAVGNAGMQAAQARGRGDAAIGGAINSTIGSLANLGGAAAAGGMFSGGGGGAPSGGGSAGVYNPGTLQMNNPTVAAMGQDYRYGAYAPMSLNMGWK